MLDNRETKLLSPRRLAMRKLRIFEHISLDGVIQHSADENGFPYSDWSGPYRTSAGKDLVLAMYGEKFDLLLGRRTYDGWSGFWPKQPTHRWFPVMPDTFPAYLRAPKVTCWQQA